LSAFISRSHFTFPQNYSPSIPGPYQRFFKSMVRFRHFVLRFARGGHLRYRPPRTRRSLPQRRRIRPQAAHRSQNLPHLPAPAQQSEHSGKPSAQTARKDTAALKQLQDARERREGDRIDQPVNTSKPFAKTGTNNSTRPHLGSNFHASKSTATPYYSTSTSTANTHRWLKKAA
jgi:hypothetical protein